MVRASRWPVMVAAILFGATTAWLAGLQPAAEGSRPIDVFMRPGSPARVIAHRGFSGRAPENTMAAFREAIAVGADMIELDVLLSRDGDVIVLHDETVDRTTPSAGRAADLGTTTLVSLDAGTWFDPGFAGEPIPLLADALDLVRDRILLNIEIKTEAVRDDPDEGIAAKVIDLVRSRSMADRVVVSSFDPRAITHLRSLAPELRTALLYSADAWQNRVPVEALLESGADGLNVSDRLVTPDLVAATHATGRPLAVYTVNDPARLRELVTLGVDAVFTDRPDLFLEVLGRVPR